MMLKITINTTWMLANQTLLQHQHHHLGATRHSNSNVMLFPFMLSLYGTDLLMYYWHVICYHLKIVSKVLIQFIW